MPSPPSSLTESSPHGFGTRSVRTRVDGGYTRLLALGVDCSYHRCTTGIGRCRCVHCDGHTVDGDRTGEYCCSLRGTCDQVGCNLGNHTGLFAMTVYSSNLGNRAGCIVVAGRRIIGCRRWGNRDAVDQQVAIADGTGVTHCANTGTGTGTKFIDGDLVD